ncbi:hypothetical protein CRUP_030236 [Coryphaenoides rupestris]|nr:hypothetical protein CRUP_030236 [Coryphaenoides rupestris]
MENDTDILTPVPSSGCQGNAPAPRPSQPWQVTRRHAAISAGDLQQAQQRGGGGEGGGGGSTSKGSRFEHRHAAQQHTITPAEEAPPGAAGADPAAAGGAQPAWRSGGLQPSPGLPRPTLNLRSRAMEERARERSARKREVEELRRRREEEKLAQMRAAEEERRREEEEERLSQAQRRREERRLQREREEEQQERLRRLQELQTTARLHHHRSLLLRRGLAPGLRVTTGGLVEWRTVLEERARGFHRAHAQRRVLRALLDLLTRQRLLEWGPAGRGASQAPTGEQVSAAPAKCSGNYTVTTVVNTLPNYHHHCCRTPVQRWRALRSCLLVWSRYPGLQRREREKEARREQLRRRVAEIPRP